jgi:flavin-dependent dehydrogenase
MSTPQPRRQRHHGLGRSSATHFESDVAIVGAGPAGCAAALTLARYTSHRVIVVERTRFDTPRVGETVSAGVIPLLRYLGAPAVLTPDYQIQAYGTAAAWGRPSVVAQDFIFSAQGNGWHLDRQRFDAMLADSVAASGAVLLTRATLRAAEAVCEGWRLQLDDEGRHAIVLARQVIDATGRAATFARRTGARPQHYDRLVGIVARLAPRLGQVLPQRTLIEAIADGWWYTAPLPQGQCVAAFMTDADLVPQSHVAQTEAFLASLGATTHCAPTLSGGTIVDPPRVHSAASSRLFPCIGANWIAAGDAAVAFDPLSSLGIGHAIASGIQAARIASARCRHQESLADSYQDDVRRHFECFLEKRRAIYAQERRWPDSPFWARRHTAAAALRGAREGPRSVAGALCGRSSVDAALKSSPR